MMNYRFERAARQRRIAAFFFTLLFHALLIAGIAYAGDAEMTDLLPQKVQQWLGMNVEEQAAEAASLPAP